MKLIRRIKNLQWRVGKTQSSLFKECALINIFTTSVYLSSVACKIVNFIIDYKNEKSKSRFLL